MRELQRQFLAIDRYVLLDPVIADLFDLLKFGDGDGTFVRKVETKFGRCDEGSSLIDVITENFSKSKVEDMSAGVIVANWPAAQLVKRISRIHLVLGRTKAHLIVCADHLVL